MESQALLNGKILLCEGNLLGLVVYRPACGGACYEQTQGRPVDNPESADVGPMAYTLATWHVDVMSFRSEYLADSASAGSIFYPCRPTRPVTSCRMRKALRNIQRLACQVRTPYQVGTAPV